MEWRGHLCGDGGRRATRRDAQQRLWYQRFCRGGRSGGGDWPALCPYAPGCQRHRRYPGAVPRGGAQDLALWPGPGPGNRRIRGHRDLHHALLFRASLARRGIYPLPVQRRVYLCSPGRRQCNYPLWRRPRLSGLLRGRVSRADDYLARAFRMDSRPRRTADRQRFLFGFPGAGRGSGQTG